MALQVTKALSLFKQPLYIQHDLNDEPCVHRLPTDILEYILLLNATYLYDDDDDDDFGDFFQLKRTLAFSQVCSRWRAIALNYSVIWAHIFLYNLLRRGPLRWIDELLRRSDPSLLEFGTRTRCIDLSSKKLPRVLKRVIDHTSRLRTFNAQVRIPVWELLSSRFLQQPAPHLEFLSFCLIFNTGRVLSGPLFNNCAPSLRSVHLRRCAIDFTSLSLKPLTELYVNEITHLGAAPTTMDWLRILGEMPSLRWFTLIDAISADSGNGVPCPAVHLEMLEMLRVDGRFPDIVTLISSLIVPSRCGLRVDGKHARPGPAQRMLWTIIQRKVEFWEMDIPDRRFTAIHNSHSIAMGNLMLVDTVWDVSSVEAAHASQKPPPDPTLTVVLRLADTADVTLLFLSLFPIFDRTFATTTYLKLWIDDSIVNAMELFLPLVDSFGFFTKLQSLDVRGDSHSYLLPILQNGSLPVSVLLPTLHTLHFLQADFRRTSGSLAPVAAFLQWRRDKGFPVHKVVIYESRVDRAFIWLELEGVEVDMTLWNDSDQDTDEERESD